MVAGARPASTSSTRTPGTPTSPATSRPSCYGVPHVLTAHSLEPRRPWKAEQLGGGYRVSSWVESLGVPRGRRRSSRSPTACALDVLDAYPFVDPDRVHVVRNGIDTRRSGSRDDVDRPARAVRRRRDPAVRRVRRADHAAEGHRAPARAPPRTSTPRCSSCSAPPRRTPRRSRAETEAQSRSCRRPATVVWIQEHAAAPWCTQLLTPRAGVPLPVGLRAARHRQPRGHGVRDRRRGLRRRRHPRGRRRRRDRARSCTTTPTTPTASSAAFADAVNSLVARPASARARWATRAASAPSTHFGWDVVAQQTVEVYLAAGAVPGAVAP